MMRRDFDLRSTILALTALFIILAVLPSAKAQGTAPARLSVAEERLPVFNVGIDVRVQLHANGGIPPYHWLLTAGELPPGITLDPSGYLIGRPQKAGSSAFTLTVTDSARPANSSNKEFHVQVTAPLVLDWLEQPAVHGTEIGGSVQVSNGTEEDDFDLTVIIVAVNEIGRATALGYQHMTLKGGVTNFKVPFGSTMPPGTYIVHADAIAEIAAKNTILRQHLQSATLQVVEGP